MQTICKHKDLTSSTGRRIRWLRASTNIKKVTVCLIVWSSCCNFDVTFLDLEKGDVEIVIVFVLSAIFIRGEILGH